MCQRMLPWCARTLLLEKIKRSLGKARGFCYCTLEVITWGTRTVNFNILVKIKTPQALAVLDVSVKES